MNSIKSCTICFEELNNDKKGTLENCIHEFCFKCICDWSSINNSCPICRKIFTKINGISIVVLTDQEKYFLNLINQQIATLQEITSSDEEIFNNTGVLFSGDENFSEVSDDQGENSLNATLQSINELSDFELDTNSPGDQIENSLNAVIQSVSQLTDVEQEDSSTDYDQDFDNYSSYRGSDESEPEEEDEEEEQMLPVSLNELSRINLPDSELEENSEHDFDEEEEEEDFEFNDSLSNDTETESCNGEDNVSAEYPSDGEEIIMAGANEMSVVDLTDTADFDEPENDVEDSDDDDVLNRSFYYESDEDEDEVLREYLNDNSDLYLLTNLDEGCSSDDY